MRFDSLQETLTRAGFSVHTFPTGQAAKDWLAAQWSGKTIGLGGSMTLEDLGLYEALSQGNTVYWHWRTPGAATLAQAAQAQVYLSSVNAVAETGELINIDGAGNRVAATLYGHQRIYFVVGRNKLAPTYEEALWRARNIAAPKNAQRLGSKTPCAVKGDRCYDCKSPDRICRGLTVLWGPMMGMEQTTEVLLIDEDLGY